MHQNNGLSISASGVNDVSRQLDELGQRMQRVMDTEKPNLTVVSSGCDEVSERIAQTANQVHDSFANSVDQAVNEVREVAATLRSHAGRIEGADLA